MKIILTHIIILMIFLYFHETGNMHNRVAAVQLQL